MLIKFTIFGRCILLQLQCCWQQLCLCFYLDSIFRLPFFLVPCKIPLFSQFSLSRIVHNLPSAFTNICLCLQCSICLHIFTLHWQNPEQALIFHSQLSGRLNFTLSSLNLLLFRPKFILQITTIPLTHF